MRRRLHGARAACLALWLLPAAGACRWSELWQGEDDLPRLQEPRAGDRVLVVAPHVDDESIAAAAYMSDVLAADGQVFVAYLTAGDCNRTSAEILDRTLVPRPQDFLREGEARIAEANKAMRRLGVPPDQVFQLGFPDRGLREMLAAPGRVVASRSTGKRAVPYAGALSPGAPYTLASLERDLTTVLGRARPTLVIAPVPFDAHSDHSAGGELMARLVAKWTPRPRLLGYLVHALDFPEPLAPAPGHALRPPAHLREKRWLQYPLTPQGEAHKRQVLRAYHSQREDPYLYLLLDAFIRRNELFVEERAAPR